MDSRYYDDLARSEAFELNCRAVRVIEDLVVLQFMIDDYDKNDYIVKVWEDLNYTRVVNSGTHSGTVHFLDPDDIYEVTWLDNAHIVKAYISKYYDRQGNLDNEVSYETVKEHLASYFLDLSNELGSTGSVELWQVRDFIENAGFIDSHDRS